MKLFFTYSKVRIFKCCITKSITQGLSCAVPAFQGAAQYARDRVQGRPVGMSKEDAKNSTIIDHAPQNPKTPSLWKIKIK